MPLCGILSRCNEGIDERAHAYSGQLKSNVGDGVRRAGEGSRRVLAVSPRPSPPRKH